MKNVIGGRVNAELEEAVKERAKNNGKTVQDVMNEVLNKEFNILPESKKNKDVNVVNVSEEINKLKLMIKKYEETYPEGFLSSRDKDIQACINALEIDVKNLINTLPNAKEEVKDDW